MAKATRLEHQGNNNWTITMNYARSMEYWAIPSEVWPVPLRLCYGANVGNDQRSPRRD